MSIFEKVSIWALLTNFEPIAIKKYLLKFKQTITIYVSYHQIWLNNLYYLFTI